MAHHSPTLRSFESKLVRRLLATQDASGGWGEHPGAILSPFNTAEAVLALSAASPVDGAAVQQSIRKALVYIYAQHECEPLPPPDSGSWWRASQVNGEEHKVADIIRTSMVIGALINTGEGSEKPILAAAIAWLVGRQNATNGDTGWGFQRGMESKVLPTCFALLALMAASIANPTNPWKNSIELGLKRLTDVFRKADGSFDAGILAAAHTIYACLVLKAARVGGYSIVASAEKDAIRWLLNNQDDALSPVEEKIEIDPIAAADYSFTFMMEALLLRVLGNSQDAGDRETQLWLNAQRAMRDAYDDTTGGFYGRRVFSWSTANGLYAVRSSEHSLQPIPPRPAEDPGGIKVGNIILFLALVLIGAVVYLAAVDKFTILLAIFFGGLVLGCLLAYGKIGERTFTQLVSQLIGAAKKDGEEGPVDA
jgi:hypothetical protein